MTTFPGDRLPDDRVREIAESPLSFAQGSYVDAWYLAKEVAELRAYRDRTEAALRSLLDWTCERSGKAADEPKAEFIDHLWGFMQDAGLWREGGA